MKILSLALLAFATASVHSTPASTNSQETVLKCKGNGLNDAISQILEQREPVENLGVVLANIHDFPPELIKSAKQELKFSDRLQIICVVKGSLADQLGLKPGDQLIQINSLYVSRGQAALQQFADRVIPEVDWNGSIDTTIIRDGFGQNHSIKAGSSRS